MPHHPANIYKRIGSVFFDQIIILLISLLIYKHVWHQSIDNITLSYIQYIYLLGVMVLYFFVFESIFAKTPGKKLFNLQVVRLDGGPAAWWQILIRNLVRPLDFTGFYLLGFIMIVLTSKAQRLGDLIGNTIVTESL